MQTITIGKKFDGKFHRRELCFGICVKEDKILLTHKPQIDEYALPGGGIELGESNADTIKRELLEETGYNVSNMNELVSIDCYWLAGGVDPMESLAHFYTITAEYSDIPSEIGCEPVWVDLCDVDQYLPLPYHKKAIEIYLNHMNKQ